ncbi:MAG: flagella basal body P-ring formation protein FlgA [Deltaproteobacteria bacterium]|nr:MAG: flagella basal body P-ring formation protein FlgA [Deltaproteobacteria bacterium]
MGWLKQSHKGIFGGLLVILVHAAWGFSETVPERTFRIQPVVHVNAAEVWLEDLLTDAQKKVCPEAFRRIRITRAPRPGQRKTLTARYVKAVILRGDIKAKTWEWDFPPEIAMIRDGQQVATRTLENLFKETVRARSTATDIEISQFRVRGGGWLAPGTVTFTVAESGNRQMKGRVSLCVTPFVDGKKAAPIYLSGWVDIFGTAVCAARHLERGTLLRASDLVTRRVCVSRFPEDLLSAPEQGVGKRLRKNITAGRPVRLQAVEWPPVVDYGNRVKLVAGSGNLRIETIGIAKEAGRVGDMIRVINAASRQQVVGRVTGSGRVEITF